MNERGSMQFIVVLLALLLVGALAYELLFKRKAATTTTQPATNSGGSGWGGFVQTVGTDLVGLISNAVSGGGGSAYAGSPISPSTGTIDAGFH